MRLIEPTVIYAAGNILLI